MGGDTQRGQPCSGDKRGHRGDMGGDTEGMWGGGQSGSGGHRGDVGGDTVDMGTQSGCGGHRGDMEGGDTEGTTLRQGQKGEHRGDVGGGTEWIWGTQSGCGGHRGDVGDTEGMWGT